MNTIHIVVAAGILALILVAVMIMKKSKPAPEEPSEETEKPECGDPALYELGMNPVSDKPIMYALTTCLHCKNTKKFLEENHYEVTVIHLDDYCDSQRSDLMERFANTILAVRSPLSSCPTARSSWASASCFLRRP